MPVNLSFWWVGIATYSFCHCVHLIGWQLHRPRRDILALLLLFLAIPIPLLAACFGPVPVTIHFWLSAQYLAIYPAFQASSPTLHMVAALARSEDGIDETELLNDSVALDRDEERTLSLQNSGLLRRDGTLTSKGRALARFFLAYRWWLGLPEGEG